MPSHAACLYPPVIQSVRPRQRRPTPPRKGRGRPYHTLPARHQVSRMTSHAMPARFPAPLKGAVRCRRDDGNSPPTPSRVATRFLRNLPLGRAARRAVHTRSIRWIAVEGHPWRSVTWRNSGRSAARSGCRRVLTVARIEPHGPGWQPDASNPGFVAVGQSLSKRCRALQFMGRPILWADSALNNSLCLLKTQSLAFP